MTQNSGQGGNFSSLQRFLLIFLLLLLLLVPFALSNRPLGEVLGVLVLAILLFFPGYLLLTAVGGLPISIGIPVCAVLGLVCVTTGYDLFALASLGAYFPYVAAVISLAGMVLFLVKSRRATTQSLWTVEGYESFVAGGLVALSVAPLFWRSGRYSGNEFVFHGPAGQDQLFHVTMVQRLLHHIPPDNFMFSGLRATVYHYFDDLTLALVLHTQNTLHLGATDLFDLYYRCYPTLIYFLIGALAYLAGRQLLETRKGGILSVLLLLGAGGLGWFLGVLQIVLHARHFVAMRAALFTTWTSWDRVDVVRPFVHRPAHYHSLLICLAAINILLRPERTRRHWILAGLLLGLMAGFNFTLAATFGAAAVLGILSLLLEHRQEEARHLAWFSLFIFLGSLPVNAAMLLSGFHNMAPGFPFRGPNLEFPTATWGVWLGRVLPAALVPLASLLLFPLVAYGVKLFGVGALARLHLGEERHRAIALVFAIAFAISFVIGTFLPYQGLEVGIIFLQPTLWMLGLFSLRPIGDWLERGRGTWRAAALWVMLGLTWAQALLSFNFSCEAVFDSATARALQEVRRSAGPDEVVAYLPSSLTSRAIWGHAEESTNFSIMAMTGLNGYFSSAEYSKFNAVPGLNGHSRAEVLANAERLYEQRRDDVEAFIKGDMNDAAEARLAKDQVRWIIVSDDAMRDISSPVLPWRKTSEIVVYRLTP